MSEMMTLAKAVITVTAKPITMAGSSCAVTARAEQMPSTCTNIGWSRFSGLLNTSLFSLENKLIIIILF